MKEIFLGTALALAAFVAVVILSVRFIKENGWDWGALPAYLMALIAMGGLGYGILKGIIMMLC